MAKKAAPKQKSRRQAAADAEAHTRALMAALGIPDTPSQRAGLTIRERAWRERSDAQAYRTIEIAGPLTTRQRAAAEVFSIWADRRMRHRIGSCLDTSRGGRRNSPETDQDAENARRWTAIVAALNAAGRWPAHAVLKLCWQYESITAPQEVEALRVGLDALADHWGLTIGRENA